MTNQKVRQRQSTFLQPYPWPDERDDFRPKDNWRLIVNNLKQYASASAIKELKHERNCVESNHMSSKVKKSDSNGSKMH